MKKLFALVLVLQMLYLSSCFRENSKSIDTTGQTETTQTAPPISSGTNVPPDTDKPNFSDLEILAKDLYRIPLQDLFSSSDSECVITQMISYREYILIVYSNNAFIEDPTGSNILILLDAKTAEILSTCRMPSNTVLRFLEGGKISAINASTLEISVYNTDFSQIAHYDACKTEMESNFAFITDDEKKLYYFDDKEEHIAVIYLDDKSEKIIYTDIFSPFYTGFYDGKIFFSIWDEGEKHYYLDISTDTVIPDTAADGFLSSGASQPLFINTNQLSFIKTADNPGLTFMIPDQTSDINFIDYRNGLLLSHQYSDSGILDLALYDIVNGTVYKHTADLSDMCLFGIGQVMLTDYGTAIVEMYTDDDVPILGIWDLPAVAEESAQIETIRDNEIDTLNTELSNKILSKHGIEIYYGEEGNSFNAPDYIAEVETNGLENYRSMHILSDTLDKYPTGIFSEMCVNGTERIKIYLCGAFQGIEFGTISTAAALAFTDYTTNSRVIALDVGFSYIFEQNIAHEFMHIMDDRIFLAESETNIPYNYLWELFRPDDMNYYYTYIDENGNEISDTSYTVMEESDENRIYFLDAYSKTFPTEDRARIMEHLFISAPGDLSFFPGPHLVEKARALCLILREVFPSVAACSNVQWEKAFEGSDIGNFDDLFNQYSEYIQSWEGVG